MKLWAKILIGFALGIIVGLIVGPSIAVIKPFGDLFIRLMKMIIVPLVFCSIVVGSSSIGDMKKFGRLGIKTLAYYFITTLIAISISITLALFINPSKGFIIGEALKYEAKEAPTVVEMLLNLIPTNPIQAMASDSILQVIVFALFVGAGMLLVGKKGNIARDLCDSVKEICMKIVVMVMGYAPIAVFALMAWVAGTTGVKGLIPLGKLIFVVYAASIIHAIVIYGGSVRLWAGMSPVKFFKGCFEAMVIMFSTCAGMVALPTSMRCAQENLGVPEDISGFVQPLGTTINMDGGAIYQGASALFIAGVYGIPLALSDYFMIIIVSTLGSIATAAVPGGSLIMLAMVLQSAGLPIEGIALVAGIDRILDMARTTLNCTGDIAGAVIISASEGELTTISKKTMDVGA